MRATLTENCRPGWRAAARARWAMALAAASLVIASAHAAGEAAAAGRSEPLSAIGTAAEAYIRSQLPARTAVESVRADGLDPRLHLPQCGAALQASLPAGASIQARTTVGVRCIGPSAWTVYIPVTVESRVTVLVLRRPVSYDTRLAAEDVAVASRKVTGAGSAFLNDPRDLQGRAVRRPLPAGTILTADMLKPEVVVHRGQTVTLVASSGAIEVRASGLALADAAAGARLRVQNLSSQKVVEGVVESSDTIRVAQ